MANEAWLNYNRVDGDGRQQWVLDLERPFSANQAGDPLDRMQNSGGYCVWARVSLLARLRHGDNGPGTVIRSIHRSWLSTETQRAPNRLIYNKDPRRIRLHGAASPREMSHYPASGLMDVVAIGVRLAFRFSLFLAASQWGGIDPSVAKFWCCVSEPRSWKLEAVGYCKQCRVWCTHNISS